MAPYRFDQLVADRVKRIERGHRLLKDHRDLAAANAVELGLVQLQQVLAAIIDVADGFAVGREKAHRRHHGLALARTGFADDSDGFAGVDMQIYALHRVDGAVQRIEPNVEIFDRENGFGIGHRSTVLRVERVAQSVADEVQGKQR